MLACVVVQYLEEPSFCLHCASLLDSAASAVHLLYLHHVFAFVFNGDIKTN